LKVGCGAQNLKGKMCGAAKFFWIAVQQIQLP